jgi:hypothetical protein
LEEVAAGLHRRFFLDRIYRISGLTGFFGLIEEAEVGGG